MIFDPPPAIVEKYEPISPYPLRFKVNADEKRKKSIAEAIKGVHKGQRSIVDAFKLNVLDDPTVDIVFNPNSKSSDSITAYTKQGKKKINVNKSFFANRTDKDRTTTLSHELLHAVGLPEQIEGHDSEYLKHPIDASQANSRELRRLLGLD
jgi:Zn-dependent peptidase ImmA (M78 family)